MEFKEAPEPWEVVVFKLEFERALEVERERLLATISD